MNEDVLDYGAIIRRLAGDLPDQEALDTLLSAVRPSLHAGLIEDLRPHLNFEPKGLHDGTKPGNTGSATVDQD